MVYFAAYFCRISGRAMSETGSSDSNPQLDQVLNVQPEVSAQTGTCSTSQTSQRRKPRAQTKWPSGIIKVAGFDSVGSQQMMME